MIHIDAAANDYLARLLQQQDIPGLSVRMRAIAPGSANGDCRLEFCEPADILADDYVVEYERFNVVIDSISRPYLEDTEVSYQALETGSQLTIRAPRLKNKKPSADASILERARYVIEAEINPQVAAHGGKVNLLEIDANFIAVLQFGGGCQGCGMKDVTLKQGVEKTLLTRVPELTGVRDATDHSQGQAPYFPNSAQADSER
jgi:Fe/S biogenesis protein NfuA